MKRRQLFVQVESGWAQDLSSSKRQQLAGEGCRPICRLLHFLEIVSVFGGKCWIVEDEVGAAADHRQQIIEVVGDTAREASHCLHLLCLAKLALETLASGQVVDESLGVRSSSIAIPDDESGTVDSHQR